MLSPSKRLYYAIEAVLYIAYHADSNPISSRDIAQQQGLPPRYLEQIMQRLVHGGILQGVRGPKGGYFLAKDKKDIALADICSLLDDNANSSIMTQSTHLGTRVIKPYWDSLIEQLKEKLLRVSVEDLCKEATKIGIAKQILDC